MSRGAALLIALATGACSAVPAPDPIAALATPVRIAATPDDDFADLAPFGAAVGSARVVALDEQTHGGREEFVLKTRLLRYLHERLGFDVLVLESGFFDVGRIQLARQSGAKVDDLAPDNIFYMYSKSAEGRALLQYVDSTQATAHPLVLAGMDSQHSGALSKQELAPQLAAFLQARGSSLPRQPGWAGFAATVRDMTALQAEKSSSDELDFQGMSDEILRELRGVRTTTSALAPSTLTRTAPRDEAVSQVGSAGWWARVVIDLQAQDKQLHEPASRARDQAMGDNVVWIADHFAPGKRLVLWGHAIHLMHDAAPPSAPPFAGTVVRRQLGDKYHVAHLTGLEGRYLDYGTLKPKDIDDKPDLRSLEHRLAARAGAALYVPPATGSRADEAPARFIDYETFGAEPGRFAHWESTFFIRQITPVTMVR